MEKLEFKITGQLVIDSKYVTYKAIQEKDEIPVTLKLLRNTYPTAAALIRFRQEYEMLEKVNHPNIIRPLRMQNYQNSLALVIESMEGNTLTEILKSGPFSISDFFQLVKPLIEAIRFLHQSRIIHKNINPSNILIETKNNRPILTGFSLAAQLTREDLEANSNEIIDTNLAYISPEQTGRMNRTLDYRTDLYSLGILFYELLAGRTPFVSTDPMEMVHCHIAIQPKPLIELRKDIPEMLSRIISHLLAKSAEERYQSASGLLFDIEHCFDLYKNRASTNNTVLGLQDIQEQFRIPEKLYGRSFELEKLLNSYSLAGKGNKELIIVSGYSGVGKSRLVSEMKKHIYQSKGYFISGKFDQFKKDIPLSSLMEAIGELIRQILTESEEQIFEWKQNILKALGQSGKLIIDVIPEVGLLLGPQPEVPELPPIESNNRFNNIFSAFVKSFTNPGRPLCLFLDDLQWIDSATLSWIEQQFGQKSLGYFQLIGAYRDNEVSASHPMLLMLDRLTQKGTKLQSINLQPLDTSTLNELVADVLVKGIIDCKDLSDLIYKKTNGNPFFTRQCLRTLNEANAIFFDNQLHTWTYNLEKAQNAEIGDNVIDLMLGQIQQLDNSVQSILKIASCIGNQFNISLLNSLSKESIETTSQQISLAVQKGLILPIYEWNSDEIENYKFLHDRVQQATHILLNEEEKKSIRLAIGRSLLGNINITEQEPQIYEIADHLNYSFEKIDDSNEIKKLVEVNLSASIRAKNATAYAPALRYIKLAMEQMPESNNAPNDPLLPKMLLQRADCEHLNGNDTIAESYYDDAIEKTDGLLGKASVYERKIYYYNNIRKFKEAYQTGREAVALLGVKLPSSFIPPQFLRDLALNRYLMGNKKIASIIEQKEMSNEKIQMAIQLMATFGRSAYQIKPELCIAVCTKMVNLCLKYGNTDGGFIGYLAFGPIFQGAIIGRKQAGFDYGQLILELVEKYKSKYYKAETHFVVGYFAMPWKRSAEEMEKYWQIAYEAGLEVGDFFHTSCACCATIQSLFMRGVAFEVILHTANRYLEFLHRINNEEGIQTISSIQQSIRNLQGITKNRLSFDTDTFDESSYEKNLSDFNSRHFAHYYYINKMHTLYLWGEYEEAYRLSLISDSYLKDSPGMLHTAEHYFYKALILCAIYPKLSGIKRMKCKAKIYQLVNKFKKYTKGCPANFIHKSQLLLAEISRINNQKTKAQNYYYSSIESANTYGYTNLQGLANSLAGKFHLTEGRKRLALFHLKEAKNAYTFLGATAYADYLLQLYPELIELNESESVSNLKDTYNLNERENVKIGNIDLSSVLKSSEAISREIHLRDLLSSLLKIIIENAGAVRMVLLINKDEHLVVLADCNAETNEVQILPELSLDTYKGLSKGLVNYVARSLNPIILDDASINGDYINDIYFKEQQTRSVLCVPLVQKGKLTSIIYLENNLTNGAFTKERIELLNLLSGQMAISIENALLYENLEEKVIERTRELNEEKEKSESLLRNILPDETAEELKRTGTAKAKEFELATVLFTDFKNFTKMSENMSAVDLIAKINHCYIAFDKIITKYGIEKIKTIGDSYMCAGGIPIEKSSNPYDTVKVAIEIRDFMLEEKRKHDEKGEVFFEVRIGLHTGPVVAGIVGIKKFAYDIWGDTVNIASRMESSGEPGRINISGTTYELVKDKFNCIYRGEIEAKNKGMVNMYFVENEIEPNYLSSEMIA
jgi:predicted ATPase/class 3 adenylate cyclase